MTGMVKVHGEWLKAAAKDPETQALCSFNPLISCGFRPERE